MKQFNTRGVCIPEEDYMVDISEKIERIVAELITPGRYFIINRPRQYGKTTILYLLKKRLANAYTVLSLSFEALGEASFQSEEYFIKKFISIAADGIKDADLLRILEDEKNKIHDFEELSKLIAKIVSKSSKNIILMIDEVDKSSNYVIFLNFLSMLRNKYLQRRQGEDKTFHSVILAGVHDIKTIKTKIKTDTIDLATTKTEGNLNSPWNIAADFLIEMSFNPREISTMLQEFSTDRSVEMNIPQMADKIYFYTSGYPFLVSRICELIDTRLKKIDKWELADIDEAVKLMLQESNANFDSLIKNLENDHELYSLVRAIIVDGEKASFNLHNPLINYGLLYGIFKKQDGTLKIHNRIYEQLIYNYMSSKIETSNLSLNIYNFADNFIVNNTLNMEKVLLKFQQFMKEQYSKRDEKFWERQGKLILLAFIKPIINGKGFDFKEAQISEEQRLDVVITFLDKKYVMELKIWRGQENHEKGLLQLSRYLENQNLDKGYLVVFDFNKSKIGWSEDRKMVEGKEIFAITV